MGPRVLLLFKLRGCPTNVHAIVTVKRGQIININFKGVAKEPRVSNSKTKLTTQRIMNSDWSSSLRIISPAQQSQVLLQGHCTDMRKARTFCPTYNRRASQRKARVKRSQNLWSNQILQRGIADACSRKMKMKGSWYSLFKT